MDRCRLYWSKNVSKLVFAAQPLLGGESETIPQHTEDLLTCSASAVLGNVKDSLSHFKFPVMDIGKQLASVSKDNLPFDQSCTRL